MPTSVFTNAKVLMKVMEEYHYDLGKFLLMQIVLNGIMLGCDSKVLLGKSQ